jgi:hypothetical protein
VDAIVAGGLDRAGLADIVRAATGRADARLGTCRVVDVDYPFQSVATHALQRVSGETADGVPWAAFVKVLQHPQHWKLLGAIPAAVREEFLTMFPWRLEIAVLDGRLADLLPQGLRLPRRLGVVEVSEGLTALWLEWVDDLGPAAWDDARYVRAARLLGRLAARRRPHLVEPLGDVEAYRTPSFGLTKLVDTRVQVMVAGMLADPRLRAHPVLRAALDDAGQRDLLDEVLAAIDTIPAVLAEVARLPHTYVHGDASPQNLLVPREAPDTMVAIDWGVPSPEVVGFDLGQLVLGLAHAGYATAADVARLDTLVVPAFTAGLADEGWQVDQETVRRGYLLSQLARSACSALPLEQLLASPGSTPADVLDRLVRERVALTRALLDLCAPVIARTAPAAATR